MVVEARTVTTRLRGERCRMRSRPRARDVLAKPLRAGINHRQAARPTVTPQLRIEIGGITAPTERPDTIALVLAPSHPPYDFACPSRHSSRAYLAPGVTEDCAPRRSRCLRGCHM
jgi:hypothetical protein